MDFWASLEHDLKYKAKREIEGIDSYGELKDCSRIIEDVEARMQISRERSTPNSRGISPRGRRVLAVFLDLKQA